MNNETKVVASNQSSNKASNKTFNTKNQLELKEEILVESHTTKEAIKEPQIGFVGALLGLTIAIILIVKKIAPVYSLMLGALLGGLLGGGSIVEVTTFMMDGAKGIIPAILRILTAGILAGVLIESGAAEKIASAIISRFNSFWTLFALALATMILTAVGVFVDVAVITVAPIALAVGKKMNYSKIAILLAMVGGGKSGNIISPNPNTIAAAENFNVELSALMMANIIPALVGLLGTFLIARRLIKKGELVGEMDEHPIEREQPALFGAVLGPIVTIMLLALRPLFGISIDPLVALPIGGIVGCLAMGKLAHLKHYMGYGLEKMSGVSILLLGTGTLAGIISNSNLKDVTLKGIEAINLPSYLLAPISGALMSGATASTTSGTTIASSTFAGAILAAGISGLAGAAMLHAGATVLDHLPHGSFFHATSGSTNMNFNERLKLVPYESLVGFILAFTSTLIYGIL